MTPNAKFHVVQIYLVSASFGYRGNPLAIDQRTPVQTERVGVNIELEHYNDGAASQVTVSVATNPADGSETALYDFAVKVAVLVEHVDREAFNDQTLAEVLSAWTYPFVRELVANLTMRGRFGPVWLNPFDVRAAIQGGWEQRSAIPQQVSQ